MRHVYVDIEASGLSEDSYPIEIAWVCEETHESDSFLINPSSIAQWHYWDETAEQIHGIQRELLLHEGIGVVEACERLNKALVGAALVSDALSFDGFWMSRLFVAASSTAQFDMIGLDDLLTQDQLQRYKKVSRSQLRRHRALPDVEAMMRAVTMVKRNEEGSSHWWFK
ncbi:MAG: hypothetical protein ACPGPF_09765 [Pontibacterium sp.]